MNGIERKTHAIVTPARRVATQRRSDQQPKRTMRVIRAIDGS